MPTYLKKHEKGRNKKRTRNIKGRSTPKRVRRKKKQLKRLLNKLKKDGNT